MKLLVLFLLSAIALGASNEVNAAKNTRKKELRPYNHGVENNRDFTNMI